MPRAATPATIRTLDRPGDLGWVIQAHGEIYAREFGWDTSFEALVLQIVAGFSADHDPAREAAWIAESGGRRVGCVFCVAGDGSTARLRILLVDPAARGRGVGTLLLDTCLQFARQAGYSRVTLWTNHCLAAAGRLYRSRGFTLEDEQPHTSFGVSLVGQTYSLAL
jgi:GNAT superfamily N-acetyltransferase